MRREIATVHFKERQRLPSTSGTNWHVEPFVSASQGYTIEEGLHGIVITGPNGVALYPWGSISRVEYVPKAAKK